MTDTTTCGAIWIEWANHATDPDAPRCDRPTNHEGPHYDHHAHVRWGNTHQMGITS